MDISYHRNWFQRQVEKADKLIEIYKEDGISDAEIILCCTTSALASTLWKRNQKEQLDKKKFVEFLVNFSKITPSVQTISVCQLGRNLEKLNKHDELKIIINRFFGSEYNYYAKVPHEYGETGSGLYGSTLASIIKPATIDTTEQEIQELIKSLKLSEIRKASYVNLIYTDLRSALIHEYELTGNVSSFGWHHRTGDEICYMNFIVMPKEFEVQELVIKYSITPEEARDALCKTERKIFFPYSYIKELIIQSTNSLFAYWENSQDFDQPYPDKWWIDG